MRAVRMEEAEAQGLALVGSARSGRQFSCRNPSPHHNYLYLEVGTANQVELASDAALPSFLRKSDRQADQR